LSFDAVSWRRSLAEQFYLKKFMVLSRVHVKLWESVEAKIPRAK
jgi:hypothetical protein